MARKAMEIMGLIVFTTMLWAGASAQSSSSCTNVLVSMSPCLSYITGNSSTPTSACCSKLATVVASQPQCLCQALNGGGSSLGININQTQAMGLPDACNVQTPPASKCNAASPSPTGTPSTPQSRPSGSGLVIVPSTDNSSGGSISKLSFSLLFFLLSAASVSSTFISF